MAARPSPHVDRRGFTLVELLIVITILGVLGTLLTGMMVQQQRFHAAVANTADTRARMRDVATILPTDIRSISSAGDDLLDIGLTYMQFRAFVGTSVLCTKPSNDAFAIPPRTLASGHVLTAWINAPGEGDIAFVYDDGAQLGNADDAWREYAITDVEEGTDATWCPPTATDPVTTNLLNFTATGDASTPRYKIELASNLSNTIRIGAPVRFAREVRYSLYEASDGDWYVGYQTCTPSGTPGVAGDCGDIELLAGPVLPATNSAATSGLFFRYFRQDGTEVASAADASEIARITVGIRTASLALELTEHGPQRTAADSLMFTIGIRNRI